jgi:hypothetical protein
LKENYMSKNVNTVTPIFRVSFPNVFKPRFNTLSKKDEYSVVALFKKGEDLNALKAAAHEACVKKWGPDQAKWPKNLKNPFKDQGDTAKEGVLHDGYEAGAIMMTYKSDSKPAVRDASNTDYVTEPSKFYAGCYARASVFALAYDVNGGRGVTFLLNHLQFARDGEPFSGRPPVESAFEPIEGADSADGKDAASIF